MQGCKPIPVEELLERLSPLHDEQLLLALQTYQVSLDTLQQIKAYSAQFYLSEPERALQIAQTAYRLGQHLPPPAGALGAWTLGNAYLHATNLLEAQTYLAAARQQYIALGDHLQAARLGVGQVAAFAYNGNSEAWAADFIFRADGMAEQASSS